MKVTICIGNSDDWMERLAAEGVQVHCAVTSPPYFGVRDYGTGTWVGGDPECIHRRNNARPDHIGDKLVGRGQQGSSMAACEPYKRVCKKCGAVRQDQQIGLEETVLEYVERMRTWSSSLWEVLRDDGTFWLNIGDSYAGSGKGRWEKGKHKAAGTKNRYQPTVKELERSNAGLKRKDLCMVPARVAIALQESGWYLRDKITWVKGFSGEMRKGAVSPSPVADRFVPASEELFLLAKRSRYFFDKEAVKEDAISTGEHIAGAWDRAKEAHGYGSISGARIMKTSGNTRPQLARAMELAKEAGLTKAHFEAIRTVGITDAGKAQMTQNGYGFAPPEVQALADEAKEALGGYYREFLMRPKASMRNVWFIKTRPFKDAHFSCYPPDLVRPCVRAGSPERCCSACGAPRQRIVDKEYIAIRETQMADQYRNRAKEQEGGKRYGFTKSAVGVYNSHTSGWKSTCDCDAPDGRATVLDPFLGSGTTAMVALAEGRDAIGIELNPHFAQMAADRIWKAHPEADIEFRFLDEPERIG